MKASDALAIVTAAGLLGSAVVFIDGDDGLTTAARVSDKYDNQGCFVGTEMCSYSGKVIAGVCVPPLELCRNGRDDDCDGETDEGCD